MRPLLRRVVSEPVVLTVIIFNLVVLFLRAYPGQQDPRDALFFLDIGCLVYFIFEIAAKIWLDGVRAFWARGINRFDLLVVALSAPTLAMLFAPVGDVSFILVLRGARVLRLFRVLRFVPDAERIWGGIVRAMRASVGIMLAFAMYNVLLGVFAAHMFAEISPEHFGTPMRALYTVFKAFTVEGWYEVPDALVASGATGAMVTFMRVFFVGAVVSGGLIGLGIVNAVFVDEMVMDNTDALEAHLAEMTAQIEALRADNAETHRLLAELRGGPDGPDGLDGDLDDP